MIEEKGSESIHHDACLIGRIIPLSESDILNRAHCQERGHTRRGALGLHLMRLKKSVDSQ